MQQLQHHGGTRPGLGSQGSGCSSAGARGARCAMLRPPAAPCPPICAAKPLLWAGADAWPTAPGTGLCCSSEPTPSLASSNKAPVRAGGPGQGPAGSEPIHPCPVPSELPCPAWPPASAAASKSSPEAQERLPSLCQLQGSVSGRLTRIPDVQKPLGIHRAQQLVLYCHV